MKPIEYSIVIPLYNEENSVEELNRRVCTTVNGLGAASEILYIDDASTDQTLPLLRRIERDDSRVRVYSFRQRSGQSCALHAGIMKAQGVWVITLDGDLQIAPEDIVQLVPYREKADCVVGVRAIRHDSVVKRISSRIACIVRQAFLRDTIVDTGCSLRLINREVLLRIPLFVNFHRFLPCLIQRLGYTVIQVPVSHAARKFGRSKYGTMRRLGEGIVDLRGVRWLLERACRYEFK